MGGPIRLKGLLIGIKVTNLTGLMFLFILPLSAVFCILQLLYPYLETCQSTCGPPGQKLSFVFGAELCRRS